MDDAVIGSMRGEIMALRLLVTELFRVMALRDPPLNHLLDRALSQLEGDAEIAAFEFGKPGHAAYLTSLSEVIEEVRTSVFEIGRKQDDAV
ncbi:MAG TPA: hypothetical protein EYH41_04310 [Novosphingobium capsulatum]|jgi:hypothetical protein|nr:hypothetical protein [Novosphingobium aromaticivorans]HIQ17210.1 hypothetical protein [Novosphingobium capsulatum]